VDAERHRVLRRKLRDTFDKHERLGCGHYVYAPAVAPSPATVSLTAKSVADTSKTAAATITVVPAVCPVFP